MDLSKLTLPELKELLKVIPKELERRERAEKSRIRKELEELAAKSGFSLDDLLAEAGKQVRRRRAFALR